MLVIILISAIAKEHLVHGYHTMMLKKELSDINNGKVSRYHSGMRQFINI